METGYGWTEVANSIAKPIVDGVTREDLKIARIVEEYTPPSPTAKNVEIKLASGQSIIHGTGKASFKIELRLIFPDGISYSDFMFYMGNTFKYYDERGGIYMGAILEQPTVARVEAGQRYDVKVQLVAVRKSEGEVTDSLAEYTDLEAGAVHTIKFTNYGYYLRQDQKIRLTFGGLSEYVDLTIPNAHGGYKATTSTGTSAVGNIAALASSTVAVGNIEGFVIPSKLAEQLKDAGYEDYFGIDYGYNILKLTPKLSSYNGVTFNSLSTTVSATVTTNGGKHFAYNDIQEIANVGIVSTQDGRGNPVYTYRPNARATRAEAITMLNNTRKWIERMLRG
jgi:hypothetical protein